MNGDINVTLGFKSGGTNFGDGVRTGTFGTVCPSNQSNLGIPTGLINNTTVSLNSSLGSSLGAGVGIPMYSIWSPSSLPIMYANQSFPPNSQGTFRLSNLNIGSHNFPPAKIGLFNGSPCVELDYGRPITIRADGPFTAIVSGYDYYGDKTVVRGDSVITTDIYPSMFTTCRGIKYLTNIQIINNSLVSTSPTVGIEDMIELPYNDLGRQSNFLLWSMSSNNLAPSAMEKKNLAAGDYYSFFYGEPGGAFSTIGHSYLPSSWDLTANPITLTSGNPRPIINIAGNTKVSFNSETTTAPIFNVFIQNVFGLGNLPNYKNSQYDYSLPDIYANSAETVFGRPNYTDSNWRGWEG